ncbi:MAG TPA: tetratricopeptide repeat protein [Burkholderiaceae bacterium]
MQSSHTAMNGKAASSVPLESPEASKASEPSDGQLLFHKARNAAYAEAAAGRISQGMSVLHQALLVEPMRYELLSDMGALLLAAGELEHAAAFARKAVDLMPHHGPSLYTLAFALAGLSEHARAMEILERLTREGPAHTSMLIDAPDLLPLVALEIERLRRHHDVRATA